MFTRDPRLRPATRRRRLNDSADVLYRVERPGEEEQIRAVAEDAFRHHPVVATLVGRLRDSPDWIDGLSFVAETEGRIVGHILFTRALLDAPRRLVDVLVLSPVGVETAVQGRGIGSDLVRHGIRQVRNRPEPLVFLEGRPAFYARFGFQPACELGLRRPSLRIPKAAFQVIRLSRYEPWMTGTLVYPRAFWDLDCVGLREADESVAATARPE